MAEQYEKELLEWKERMFLLRGKYKDTPPGFENEEQEKEAMIRLREERKQYEERNTYRLLTDYVALEECFAGRERYLAMIEEQLASGKSPVILYGIGGIGKTALTREYIRRHQEEYDKVLFLSYNRGLQKLFCDDCQVSVSNLYYSQDKYGNISRYFREKLKVLSQIAEKEKLLIVIDDCNTGHDRRMKEVFALPCDFIVTTRVEPAVWGNYPGIRVKELETEEEWRAFIRAYQKCEVSSEEWKALMEYCRRIHGHTLMMALRLRGVEKEVEAQENFAEDLFRRFSLKKDEKQALRELSIMPVQGIPASLYYQISKVPKSAVDQLTAYLLVRRENRGEQGEFLSLHPIIAEAAQKVFTPTLFNCHHLIQGFYEQIWNSWNRTYLENQRLEPYVFAILKAFPEPLGWLARPLEELVTWLWIQGYYREAENYCRKIVNSTELYYGKIHQTTGEMCLRMAAVYYNSLEFRKANAWYWKGFNILKSCKPFDARYEYVLSIAYSKIARIYRYRKKYKTALELTEEALLHIEQYRLASERSALRLPYDGRWKMLYCYIALDKAKILLTMNRIEESEIIWREAWSYVSEIQEGQFRGNEFNSLLVKILMQKGEYEKAQALCLHMVEQAVAFRGRHFKDTLSCREQLADVYASAGQREAAIDEYEGILMELKEEYPFQTRWIAEIWEKRERVIRDSVKESKLS